MKKLIAASIALIGFAVQAQNPFIIYAMHYGSTYNADGYWDYYNPDYVVEYNLQIFENTWWGNKWHYEPSTWLFPSGPNSTALYDNRNQGSDKVYVIWKNYGVPFHKKPGSGSPQVLLWVQGPSWTDKISRAYIEEGWTWAVFVVEYNKDNHSALSVTPVGHGTSTYTSDVPTNVDSYETWSGQFSTYP